MKKNVKYVDFNDDSDLENDEDETKPKTDEQLKKEQMEEGGFTLVETGDSNMHSKKSKTADGMDTTMLGVSQEEAQNIYRQSLKRLRLNSDDEEYQKAFTDGFNGQNPKKLLKNGLNGNDFYKF